MTLVHVAFGVLFWFSLAAAARRTDWPAIAFWSTVCICWTLLQIGGVR
jgi:hypothetical protein